MYRFRLRLLVIVIGLITLGAACQPEPELPLSVTSKDRIGEISLSAPSVWSVYAEPSQIEGRQGVTFVQFPNRKKQDNLDAFPVVRVNYDPRSALPIASGTSLADYAALYLQAAFPNASFEPAQAAEIHTHPAVRTKGVSNDATTYYHVMFVEFVPENALVSLILTSPQETAPYEADVVKIAESIKVKVLAAEGIIPVSAPGTPTFTPVPPESTPEIPPETTPEATAEITDQGIGADPVGGGANPDVASEVTDEAPQPPDEIPTAQAVATTEAIVSIPEVVMTEAPATPEEANTGLGTEKGSTALNGQVTVQYPILWSTITNNQNYVGLSFGENVTGAIVANRVIPSGEAFISVEIGTSPEILGLMAGAEVDLRMQLTVISQAEASGSTPAPSFGAINALDLGGKPSVGVKITSGNSERYLVLTHLGGQVYGKLELTTAPGELNRFEPIFLEVASSLSFPQQ